VSALDEAAVSALAALSDPTRRALYELAGAHPEGLTRDAAAREAHLPRHVAAYQLDQLAAVGLLEVTRRRQGGRTGPGAGRPAKVYTRATAPLDVSLPPRNHRLAAEVLLDARRGEGDLARAAERCGARLGAAAAARAHASARPAQALVDVLRGQGFEPARRGAAMRLRNCAFHELAERDRATICAMNLALMRGIAGGLGLDPGAARSQPETGVCCVTFELGPAH
jgi:predicted ArsR family transcriptional regulator